MLAQSIAMQPTKWSLLLVATTLLGVGAVGCSHDGEADCAAADARVKACGLTSTGYQSFYYDDPQICSSDDVNACMAECIANASCSDLASFTPQDAQALGDGCTHGDGPAGQCMDDCVSGQECDTPLVLSFDGAPVTFSQGAHPFDFRSGRSVVTDWPTAATPWLALDRNGNGAIDDASELFGSASPLAAGGVASNGFQALADFDTNGDSRISPEDEVWPRLVVWSDRNGDRVSTPDEIAPLDQFGIVSIDLGYARVPRCDTRGNCEVERAAFRFRASAPGERVGEVVDVYLRSQRDGLQGPSASAADARGDRLRADDLPP